MLALSSMPAQVSDIKRSNSLLSDSAMFARDSLLIPKRPLPMGCAAQSTAMNKGESQSF